MLEPEIAARWAKEAGAHGARAVAQVAWEAAQPEPRPAAVIGTYGSDDALPAALHGQLAAGFARLHAAQPAEVALKDWHPGSSQQVRSNQKPLIAPDCLLAAPDCFSVAPLAPASRVDSFGFPLSARRTPSQVLDLVHPALYCLERGF